MGPFSNFHQRLPELFLVQCRIDDIRAGDDHRVQALLLQFPEITIVLADVCPRFGSAIKLLQRKGIDVKLCDSIAAADQAYELIFRRSQRGIRHHVEKTNVQLANVLLFCAIKAEHFLT